MQPRLLAAAVAATVAALLLGACAPLEPPPGGNPLDMVEYSRKVPRIIVQVCVPAPSADRVGLSQVRPSRHGDGGSYGGGAATAGGTTVGGQPYYEDSSDPPHWKPTLVVTVRKGGEAFVFRPPGDIPRDRWTEWFAPNYASANAAVERYILAGRFEEDTATGRDAPRIRYILMPSTEHLKRIVARREHVLQETVPDCSIAARPPKAAP